ncbi:MAG: cyclic nucleotide-binding domain-containing protein [Desulfatibacillaceae bacterium]
MELEKIREYMIFAGLSRDEIAAILARGVQCSYEKNDVILEESSKSADLFIILEGRVSVEVDARQFDQTRRKQIVLLRPGDVFGEIGFLEGMRRSAHVIAIDNVVTYRLDADNLNDLFEHKAHIGYRLMRNLGLILARRLLDANFRWRDEIR